MTRELQTKGKDVWWMKVSTERKNTGQAPTQTQFNCKEEVGVLQLP